MSKPASLGVPVWFVDVSWKKTTKNLRKAIILLARNGDPLPGRVDGCDSFQFRFRSRTSLYTFISTFSKERRLAPFRGVSIQINTIQPWYPAHDGWGKNFTQKEFVRYYEQQTNELSQRSVPKKAKSFDPVTTPAEAAEKSVSFVSDDDDI